MFDRLWIYADQDGQSGPVGVDQLKALLAEGRITGETPVRPSGEPDWAPLSTWLPELAPPGRPPIPVAKGAWTDTKPHPWRRYFARTTDVLIVGSLSWWVFAIVFFIAAPKAAEAFFAIFDQPYGRLIDVVLTLMATVPATALMIGLTGVSIGKWLFGIKVVRPDGRPIGLVAAFGREMQVWLRGWGLGIPLVSLFTLISSFRILEDKGRSDWDMPSKRVLLHRPMNALQITLIVLTVPLIIAARIGLMALSRMS